MQKWLTLIMLQIKKNEENIIKIGRTFPIIYIEYQ